MAEQLPMDFELQKQQLNRQQKMAEALLAQGQQMSQGPAGQMVSGRYVPNSFWQNAQGPVNQVIGAYLANKGDEKAAALAQELRNRQNKSIEDYQAASVGTPAIEGGIYGPNGQLTTQTTADMYGPNMQLNPAYRQVAAQEAKGPDFKKMMAIALDPYAHPVLRSQAEDMLKGKVYKKGDVEYRTNFATGQREIVGQGNPDIPAELETAITLLGVPSDPKQWTPQIRNAVDQKVTALKKASGTNFNFTDIMGKDIGQVREILNEGRNQVQAGEMSLNAANKIDQALKTGNINVGPAANVGQYIGQLGDALGYQNEKGAQKLVNTRQAIQGLAQMWASSRQQAKGQGTMTEGESQLYGKISSGELDKISIPELKYMVESTKSQGNYYRNEYERKLNHLRTIPQYKDIVPLYEVGAMPNVQYKPSGNSAVRTRADEIIGGQ